MNKKGYSIVVLVVTFLTMVSCKVEKDEMLPNVVVRVNTHALTIEQVKAALPSNLSEEDSIQFAQQFIQKWIVQKLMIEKALVNISDDDEEIKRMVEDYREALILKKYTESLVNTKVNFEPSTADVDSFYKANSKEYVLKEDIVSGVYFKLPVDAPNQIGLREWIKEFNEENRLQIEDYCLQNASIYDDFSKNWVAKSKIEAFFPDKLSHRLSKGMVVSQQDSVNMFYLLVFDVKNRNHEAPLLFTEENIIKLLKHKNKLSYMRRFEKELYNEGIRNEYISYNPVYKAKN